MGADAKTLGLDVAESPVEVFRGVNDGVILAAEPFNDENVR